MAHKILTSITLTVYNKDHSTISASLPINDQKYLDRIRAFWYTSPGRFKICDEIGIKLVEATLVSTFLYFHYKDGATSELLTT